MEKNNQKIYQGKWWNPQNPDKEFEGDLTISPNNEIKLTLKGLYKNEQNKFLIIGVTNYKEEITLVDCHISGGSSTHLGDGNTVEETIIESYYALIGNKYNSYEEIKFIELWVKYSGINDWVDVKRLDIQENNSSLNIKNYNPFLKEIKLSDGNKIIIESSWYNHYNFNDEVIIKKHSGITFKFTQKLSFQECLEYIEIFRNFLSVSTHRAISTIRIDAIIDENIQFNNIPHTIEIFNSINKITSDDKIHWHETLFTLRDIVEEINLYVANFYDRKESLKHIYNSYYSLIKNTNQYIDEEFLAYSRLLESYHRQNSVMDSFDLPRDEFRSRKKTVTDLIKKFNPELSDWIKEVICRYGNNKSFKKILQNIFISINGILTDFLNSIDVELFIQKVIYTRNLLTHPNNAERTEIDYIKYIYPMTRKLEILLLIVILKEIGFNPEKIKNIFSDRTDLRYFFKDKNWKLEV